MIGDLDISRINAHHVSQFLNRSQVSAKSFHAKHSLLRHFFQYWAARGEIAEMSMPPNRPRQRTTFLPYIYTREELRHLLKLIPVCRTANDKVHPKTLRAALLLLYATGATSGEVVRLLCGDVNLENGIVSLSGSGSKGGRSIPIGKDLTKVFRQYGQWRERVGIKTDRFFSKIDEGLIDSGTIYRYFDRLRRKARLAGFANSTQKPCVRDLRATFAVHQITGWIKKKKDLGVMVPALAEYIGNAVGLDATERYLRFTPARFQNALNKLSPSRSDPRWQVDPALLRFLTEM